MNIEIKQKELYQYFFPFINREYKDSDPQIQYVFRQNRFKFAAERLKTFFREILGSNTRKPEDVKRQYNDSWKKIDYNQLNLEGKYCKNLYTVQWGDRYFDINMSGIARLHLFCIKKIIDSLGPASAAEIGFGSGNKLLPLSVALPNIKFGGIELSDSGIGEAKRIIDDGIFPDAFQAFIPFALHDYEALSRLEIIQGSAEKLPFPDKSYDLVYTSQALEQMELIREQVMFEISRIAKKPQICLNDKSLLFQ